MFSDDVVVQSFTQAEYSPTHYVRRLYDYVTSVNQSNQLISVNNGRRGDGRISEGKSTVYFSDCMLEVMSKTPRMIYFNIPLRYESQRKYICVFLRRTGSNENLRFWYHTLTVTLPNSETLYCSVQCSSCLLCEKRQVTLSHHSTLFVQYQIDGNDEDHIYLRA